MSEPTTYHALRMVFLWFLHPPLAGVEIPIQHDVMSSFEQQLVVGARERTPPPLVVHPPGFKNHLDGPADRRAGGPSHRHRIAGRVHLDLHPLRDVDRAEPVRHCQRTTHYAPRLWCYGS